METHIATNGSSLQERVERMKAAMPEKGLFADKQWRVGLEPLSISEERLDFLHQLGERLHVFARACNLLYRQSFQGKAPAWVAQWLDAGKPRDLIELSRCKALKNQLPVVIRPDLIMTEEGWALTEIDSVPGGVGLMAWLNQTYSQEGFKVIGSSEGMLHAVKAMFPRGDVVIAEEALDYEPEWQWLVGAERVKRAETYQLSDQPVYRFFEAFDWDRLHSMKQTWSADIQMTPPLKPFLEEKLWLAFLWMKPLEDFWMRELGRLYFRDLRNIVPYSWVVHPTALPPHAVLPGLGVHSWEEVTRFSQKQRQLILKISGFSPLAWGSRGVTLGSDVSGDAWKMALQQALNSFEKNPYILQRYEKGAQIEVSFWDDTQQTERVMQGRARICPYYFVQGEEVSLQGIKATVCPADKKLIHGMRDAVIVPLMQQ
ncbi:MAG: hypothetical protein AAF984_03605 [Verrucomicrobiota bacterium]